MFKSAIVLKLWKAQFGFQPIAAARCPVCEQALRVHSKLRSKFGIVEEGAVFDKPRTIAAGGKSLVPAAALEGQRRSRIGRKRCVETIDPVLIGLVVFLQRRARNIDFEQFRAVVEQANMQHLDRRTGVVDHGVGPRCLHPALLWIKVNGQRYIGDRGLFEIEVLKVFFLIIREQFFLSIVVSVGVLYIHLIVEKCACAN